MMDHELINGVELPGCSPADCTLSCTADQRSQAADYCTQGRRSRGRDLRAEKWFGPAAVILRWDRFLPALLLILSVCTSLFAQQQPPPVEIQFGGNGTPPTLQPIPASPAQPNPAQPNPAQPQPSQQQSVDVPVALANRAEELVQAISARLQPLQDDKEQLPEVKEPLLKQYQQALADLKLVMDAQKQRNQFQARIAAAPRIVEEAKARRAKTATQATLSDSLDYMSFDEVQKELQGLQAELATTTELRTKLSEQIVSREKRRKELPQLMADARGKLEVLDTSSPAAEVEDPIMKEAIEWSKTAARLLATETLQTLEVEQRAYEAEGEALPLQLELAQATENQQQEQVRKVTEELNRMRQDRILQLRDEIRALVSALPADEKPSSDELLNRIATWLELSEKRAEVKAELDSSRTVLDHWRDRFERMKGRVDPQDGQDFAAGFNSWIGLMLRKQRSELPDVSRLNSQIREYQQELQSAESMLFTLEDALLDTNNHLELARSSLGPVEVDDSPRTEVDLLEKGKEVINAMQVDVDGYLNDVLQVADIKEQTLELTHKYASFIDEHVLWIRSSERLQPSDVSFMSEAFRWLFSYSNWQALLIGFNQDFLSQPWWYAIFTVAWLTLLFNQSRLRRILGQLSELAAKKNCVTFRYTLEAAISTLLISAPAPLLFLFLHWRLRDYEEIDGLFATALGNGFLLATAVFVPLELMRQTCRVGGLGIKHFEWTEGGARILRTNLRWLIDFSLPAVMIIAVVNSQHNARWESSLGRAVFILLMLLLTTFFARIFVPSTGVLARYIKAYPNGWFERLRYGWYSAIVFIPLSLAILSFVGYHYTAQRLASHLNTTLWLIVLLTLLFFLLRRWLLLSRRKLMLTQAKQRLAEAARRDPNQPTPPAPDEAEVNLVVINEQTMRLVSSFIVVSALVAVFMIWSDVLPAIALLENFKLWTVKGDLPDESINITLANLVFLIPIAALMVIAGRNVPGLLEIALLQHLPITSAGRYAITTLSRYSIFIFGIILLSNTIGLRWSSIQWLAAAFGVGLGFGLQEIFANFVSGLILLFEQPIRVGDTITIDGVTGSVSKIRMRATTIVNWDRQELIIPNKDLITGKLLNWTLSDSTNRIVIEVGVAYGTDTTAACSKILAIAKSHPNVLVEPEPVATFDKFGESALILTLRLFLANLDVRLKTLHELNTSIYREFQETGIEIAFPQRDLNIRSLPPQIVDWLVKR